MRAGLAPTVTSCLAGDTLQGPAASPNTLEGMPATWPCECVSEGDCA